MSIATILVIEDNVADIVLLRLGLDQIGEPYELEVLPDGEAALKFVADHRDGKKNHLPCVILLDLHLPRYNGVDVLAAIKEEPRLSHIQVVILSSFVTEEQQAELIELGALLHTKPTELIQYEALAAYILALCRHGLEKHALAH